MRNGEAEFVPDIWVGGLWRSALEGGRREIRCPADGSLVGEIDEATGEDTEAAIGAAHAAFHHGPWPHTSARERGDLLLRLAGLLERDKAEIARAESLDTGKRLVESEFDVDDVVRVFRYYGHVADEDAGRLVDTGNAGVVSRIVHEPLGVCGLITPWNYPLLQTSWKVAPCLAAGNTFVLKPSEQVPLSRLLAPIYPHTTCRMALNWRMSPNQTSGTGQSLTDPKRTFGDVVRSAIGIFLR